MFVIGMEAGCFLLTLILLKKMVYYFQWKPCKFIKEIILKEVKVF